MSFVYHHFEEFNSLYPNCRVTFPYSVGDGSCKNFDGYNTEECGWDGGDCVEFNEMYPDCDVRSPSFVGDGRCELFANTTECGYDGGDCI